MNEAEEHEDEKPDWYFGARYTDYDSIESFFADAEVTVEAESSQEAADASVDMA